jgi:CBS domain-containing protein
MKVREIMTKEVHCCRPDSTARHALALMWKHDVGVLPLVDGQDHVVGVVTDRDIAMALGLRNVAPNALQVNEITSHEVWSVDPTSSIEDAEKMLEQKQVRRLPVIEGGKLVGVVTLADLARAKGVPDRKVADAYAAITEPRNDQNAPTT